MDNQPSQFPFTQQMQIKEAHLRGTYLSICCDYERLISEIITICECPNKNNIERDVHNHEKIRHLTMGKKFGRLKRVLKPYTLYYKIIQPELTTIKKLIEYRNMLAHGYSNFDEDNSGASLIEFDYLDDSYKQKNVKIDPQKLLLELENYRKGIMELMQLAINLMNVQNPV